MYHPKRNFGGDKYRIEAESMKKGCVERAARNEQKYARARGISVLFVCGNVINTEQDKGDNAQKEKSRVHYNEMF